MHLPKLSAAVLLTLSVAGAYAAERARITVTNDLDIARPSQTITLPWSEINRVLPGALIQKIAVKDAKGRVLAHQVTNVAPLAKDPQGVGAAYGELIFQHDFKAGEKTATFTVEKIATVAPVFPQKANARYVQERLDDFAWENDKVAHRTYGPALGAPAQPGSGKEVLVTSGLDVWFKRVSYPIIDRWYNKGHDHYHIDQGEGMDMYQVGKSRGCGGTGIWDGTTLATAVNYKSWKVLANGPVRAVFELTYDGWNAAGTRVSEVKRFTVDAGHYLDQIDSTFTFAGPATLDVAVGLNKTPTDKGQEPAIAVIPNQAAGTLLQWIEQKSNGKFGTAVVLPGAHEITQDGLNHLIVTKAESGMPVRYLAGAAWDRGGDIRTRAQWENYVAAQARRFAAPVKVSITAMQ